MRSGCPFHQLLHLFQSGLSPGSESDPQVQAGGGGVARVTGCLKFKLNCGFIPQQHVERSSDAELCSQKHPLAHNWLSKTSLFKIVFRMQLVCSWVLPSSFPAPAKQINVKYKKPHKLFGNLSLRTIMSNTV